MSPHADKAEVEIVEDVTPPPKIRPYAVFLVLLLGMASAATGYCFSIIATTLTQPSFYSTMNVEESAAAEQSGLIGATMGLLYAGGAFGAICSGWCSHRYGRKMAALSGSLLVLLSSALQTGSVNMGMFITFRFFGGWGAVQLLTTIPLWIAELVPPSSRGILVDVHVVLINFGYTSASYTGVGFYHYKSGGIDAWRGPMGISMFFPLAFLIGIYWIPESPRFLLSKDRVEQAWKIIHRLHSDPKDHNSTFARKELYQIHQQMILEKTLTTDSFIGNLALIFKKKSYRKRAFLTIYLIFAQMSSGTIVMTYYSGQIIRGLGYDTPTVLQIQAGYQLMAFFMCMVNMLYVDKVARNKLLSMGFVTGMITVIVETALQRYYLNSTNKAGLAACAAMLFLNAATYNLFLEGPTFSYLAEIWPTFLRGEGLGLGMLTYSLTCIVWLQSAPTALARLHWKYYIMFIIFDAISAVVVWFYPDTLGLPLEEVAAVFGDDNLVAVYQKDINKQALAEEFRVDGLGDTSEELRDNKA